MSFPGFPRLVSLRNQPELPPVETAEDLLKLTHGGIATLHMNWRLGHVRELVFMTERVTVSVDADLVEMAGAYRAYVESIFGRMHECNLQRHFPHRNRMYLQLSWERPLEPNVFQRLIQGVKP